MILEKEILLSRLTVEEERCFSALTDLVPGSEEYDRCLSGIYRLHTYINYMLPTNTAPGVYITPLPDPSPGDPTDKPGDTVPNLKKEEVRAALADARLKGVNVSKLITDLGAPNLTSVDPADYQKLMDALAKELEGK